MAMGEKKTTAISRRDFARRAALVSAAASFAPINVLEAGSKPATVPPSAGQAQQPANLPKLTPESQAEVETRVQSILGQYGSRLSEEQKADIRRLCTITQPPLDRLRAYNLQNGDSPALYLRPLVEREKKKPTPPARAAAPHATSPSATSPSAASPATKTPTATPPAAKAPVGTKSPSPGAAKAPASDAPKKP
jgi:hypothetical protein